MGVFAMPHRARWAMTIVLIVGLLVAATATVTRHAAFGHASASPPPAGPSQPTTPRAQGPIPSTDPQPATGSDAAVMAQLNRMRHLPAVSPPSEPEPSITGDATTQPDLYAAEFVRRLLTQDFRTPRDRHLAWVQSESAKSTEPLVVGLVPSDLRDRLAAFTVTDDADHPALVPAAATWTGLAGHAANDATTVEQVIEPLPWRNAVAAGRIIDPGVTCRIVGATVTRHEQVNGKATTAQTSVSVTLAIEGPPTRASWGFVAIIDVTTLPMGAS